jgi:hypothetical protein
MAERTRAAVLVVRHLNKMVSVDEPLYRGGGSIGIIGAARSALLIGKHPEDPNGRVLCRTKGNLSPEPRALAFTIEPYDDCGRLAWEGEVDFTAADLLARGGGRRGRKPEAQEAAIAFLNQSLESGPKAQEEVVERAEQLKISKSTLNRAKKVLNVRSARRGGKWFWELPSELDPGEHQDEDGAADRSGEQGCQNSPGTLNSGNLAFESGDEPPEGPYTEHHGLLAPLRKVAPRNGLRQESQAPTRLTSLDPSAKPDWPGQDCQNSNGEEWQEGVL